MNKKIIALTLCLISVCTLVAQQTVPTKGLTVHKSITFKKGMYALDGYDSLKKSAIVIEGSDIVVDFSNAVLQGSRGKNAPDQFFGTAIIIRNSKNITLKNLTAKGYKVAVLAQNVENLTIENCDFSYNYRQHLNSTQEKEDLSDWMSYHHNENDEWLRYGAAMYLRKCYGATIKNCKVTGGQNALMLMECNNGLIANNDFSFNSGIGLGMYKSSNNKVLYNKLIFNVRGYSDGVYNRGQDSAGILVYEQSSNNLFYKNNVTHGGDGFFLWAGQATMDNGQGGCNDNVLLQNDFSYAPTNGVEVTFSRNKILNNRIVECDHGIWGGYSFNTLIGSNQFDSNRISIAIEHGQENAIFNNTFANDKASAIRLWSRKEQPADWGYAKYRDTRSRSYAIFSNTFQDEAIAFDIIGTDTIRLFNNTFSNVHTVFKTDSSVTNMDTAYRQAVLARFAADTLVQLPQVADPKDPFQNVQPLAGRKNIRMREWGPYNFQYPILWNTNPTDSSGVLKFELLAPAGSWKIVSAKGVEALSAKSGTFPAVITARKQNGSRTDIEIVAEYTGPTFTDGLGNKKVSGKPYRFSFKKFFQPIHWRVAFFDLDSSTNPVPFDEVLKTLQQTPFKQDTVTKLEYAWWGGIEAAGKKHPRFATFAKGTADLLPGLYEISVTWDDAVRLYVDGKLVLDQWNPSLYNFDESPNRKVRLKLAGGTHRFKVAHMELGNFATLSLKLDKVD